MEYFDRENPANDEWNIGGLTNDVPRHLQSGRECSASVDVLSSVNIQHPNYHLESNQFELANNIPTSRQIEKRKQLNFDQVMHKQLLQNLDVKFKCYSFEFKDTILKCILQ